MPIDNLLLVNTQLPEFKRAPSLKATKVVWFCDSRWIEFVKNNDSKAKGRQYDLQEEKASINLAMDCWVKLELQNIAWNRLQLNQI